MAVFNNSDSEPDNFLNINDYENDLRNVQTQASEGDASFSEGETLHHSQATRQTSTAGRQSETTSYMLCLCDVTLSAYPHRAGLKNMPGHGGIRTYDLWNTSPIALPTELRGQVGSNPAMARHIFQACPVWICTQSNITQTSYSPEYITPTQQIS